MGGKDFPPYKRKENRLNNNFSSVYSSKGGEGRLGTSEPWNGGKKKKRPQFFLRRRKGREKRPRHVSRQKKGALFIEREKEGLGSHCIPDSLEGEKRRGEGSRGFSRILGRKKKKAYSAVITSRKSVAGREEPREPFFGDLVVRKKREKKKGRHRSSRAPPYA